MTTATSICSVPGKGPAPNTRLVEMTSELTPGQALELGCGNGGDALWLAQRGWKVTALDISATSVDRLTHNAQAAGFEDRITATRTDLNQGLPSGEFDSSTPTICMPCPAWTAPGSSESRPTPCGPEDIS